MKKSLLLLMIIAAFSCNQKNTQKDNEINISEEVTTQKTTANTLENSEVLEKLQGTWTNNLDYLSTLTFEGNSVINAYQDTLSIRKVEFVLGNSCLNAPAVAEEDKKDLYITTKGKPSECYLIKELNDSILKMTFVDGNIDLIFNRKK
ncbi:MAG: hypothetical protein ACSHW7_10780 [Patiriisocius sp.]|uniref:hypothetical protein n=1 Tax=Patiriisocius sp. TaxID=2822396 RepID=UPI003EF8013A